LNQLQSGAGLLALCALAWACGGFRRGVSMRVVACGLLGTVGLAGAMLHFPPLRALFGLVGRAVDALARATQAGTQLVFGYLGGGPLPFAEAAPGSSFILFFQALPLVLLVGALSALLYHWRVLPLVIGGMAGGLRRLFGLGGAAGLSVAANVFVGMVEAPLLIKPWLARLATPELFVAPRTVFSCCSASWRR
jgi:CNT family concentrative nucleoside transporter